MGAIAVTVPLIKPGVDEGALLRAIWERASEHIASRLLSSRATRSIMSTYAAMQASDGLSSGDWFASREELFYTWGDAAGLCVCESNAVWHWLQLAVLDRWNDLQAIANASGAELAPPNPTQLNKLLTSKQSSVLFTKGTMLGYASQSDAPASDHQIFFVGKSTALGRIPAADRARITDAIVRGVCLCEACEKLRAMHGLPLAAATTKPKKSAARVEGPPLTDANVVTAEELSRVDPKSVVALDLAVPWDAPRAPSPEVISLLPAMPLRALGMVNNAMRVLPKELLACAGLEVLALAGTGRVRFPADLAKLSRLRAFSYDYNPRGTKAADFALLCRIPSLEVIDDAIWGQTAPAALSAMTNLRHLELFPRDGAFPLAAKMPLESVITYEPFRELAKLPLRYFDGPIDALGAVRPEVEFIAITPRGPLPERVRSFKNLRGLHVTECTSLPPWLEELPRLEVLSVSASSAASDGGDFSVVSRMSSLRCVLANETARRRGLERDARLLERSWNPLALYRALCTTRAAPEWWLSRFRFGAEFERLSTTLRSV